MTQHEKKENALQLQKEKERHIALAESSKENIAYLKKLAHEKSKSKVKQ